MQFGFNSVDGRSRQRHGQCETVRRWLLFVVSHFHLQSGAPIAGHLPRFVLGEKVILPRSRFRLSVSAGSQKRTIHEPEGRNDSRFSSISKK